MGGKDVSVEGSGCGVCSTLISRHPGLVLVRLAELHSGAEAAWCLAVTYLPPGVPGKLFTSQSVSYVKTGIADLGLLLVRLGRERVPYPCLVTAHRKCCQPTHHLPRLFSSCQ